MAKSIYEMGTSPRKIAIPKEEKNNIRLVEDNRRQSVKMTAKQRNKQIKSFFIVASIFVVLLTISYRNSVINEIYAAIQSDESTIAELQKQNEQTIISIENGLNLNTIEKEAKEQLGMQKVTNTQTEYITLPTQDYIAMPTSEYIVVEEETLYDKILEKIFGE